MAEQTHEIIELPMTDKGFELLNQAPWPKDIARQLEALERKAKGEDKVRFGHVWESYIVQGGE